MKDKILKLRAEGNSYNQICKVLGCAKSTVSYYCGQNQKEKTVTRNREHRKENFVFRKTIHFKEKGVLNSKSVAFQRRNTNGYVIFKWKDVIEKHGWKTKCYLTGRPINLSEPRTYQFDHIIPVSKGGTNSLENLGITCKEANTAKSNLSIPELLSLCKEILEHNGFRCDKV